MIGRLLQEIIDTDGPDAYKTIDEETILSLHSRHAVIATKGSVVFNERAMEPLTKDGVVVYMRSTGTSRICRELSSRMARPLP
jgi:shikimate kinase